MTDQHHMSKREAALDALLRDSFQQPGSLPGEFEDVIMERVNEPRTSWLKSHRVFLVMASYWAIAASICGAMIAGETVTYNTEVIKVLVPIVILSLLPVWLMIRKSRINLSSLFLKTLQ